MLKRRDESAQLKLDIYDLDEMERLRAENNRLQELNVGLMAEIERLKQLLHSETHVKRCHDNKSLPETMAKESACSENAAGSGMVTKQSKIEEKIRLFRSYFKGREDVYAVRGFDRTGKPAYFPQKEWLGKENGKIIWGDFLHLTDKVIKSHLQEENRHVTIGIYPLLLDETCWFLAIDFDKACWKEDTAAFLETCEKLNVLRDEQKQAVHELLQHDTGILSATTAFGKTVVGAAMIAARGVNTLILVHRTQLMEQWKEQLSVFLNIPVKEIGLIGGGKTKRTGGIDVAMLQSIHAKGEIKDFIADYGQIVVDECHHISAFSFEQVLKQAKAKYILGLTATLLRKDGHHPIVLMQCGPVRYQVDAKSQAKTRPFHHVVIPRFKDFKLPETEPHVPIHELYDKLIDDELRNQLIFDDLLKSLDQGRSPILLTDRTSHLEYFENRLLGFAKNVIVLRGGIGKKQWKAIQEQIRSIPGDQERVLIATGRFIGEGFDDARLDTLFLVMPISWKGTLQQYAGRLHRLYE